MSRRAAPAQVIFISLLLFNCFSATAQKNYQPGFVMQRGDTIRGLIDYRNWKANPDVILFKTDLNAESLQFAPFDIERFGVAGELYESARIQTDISFGSGHSAVESSGDVVLETVNAFIQTLISGEKSLYAYVNRVGKNQYYIKVDTTYDLLIFKKYTKFVDGRTGIFTNNTYLRQLASYFSACPSLMERISEVKYQQKSLEGIFVSYYGCQQSTVAFKKDEENTIVDLGVTVGIARTALVVEGVTHLEKAGGYSSTNFIPGFYFEVIPARNQRRWSLYNEITYSAYEIAARYEEYQNENSYAVYNSTLGLSYLKMTTMVRLKRRFGLAQIFINAGITNGFAVAEKNFLEKKIKQFSDERVEQGLAIEDVRKYEQGYAFGVGSKFQRFSLEARFERGNGMSKYTRVKTATTRLHLFVGYRL